METDEVVPWGRLVASEAPVIRRWLHHRRVPRCDWDDLVQQVFAVVARKLPYYAGEWHDGAFRGWLYGITCKCLANYQRKCAKQQCQTEDSLPVGGLAKVVDPASGPHVAPVQEYQPETLTLLLKRVKPDFSQQTWDAFQRVTLDGQCVKQVAAELGMEPHGVAAAKWRVANSMRRELAKFCHNPVRGMCCEQLRVMLQAPRDRMKRRNRRPLCHAPCMDSA